MFDGFDSGTHQGIAYVKGGSGPPVLLLHGYPQTKALWAQVAPLLAQEYTVVCADLRGYGDSFKPENTADNAPYSFRAMAQDQVTLMAALGFDHFHLVGHDRGGRTAHRLALDHDCLLSLTLMDIIPTLLAYDQTDMRFAQTYWHWFFLTQPAPFPETLIAADPDHFYQSSLLGWGAAELSGFNADMLTEYRRAWRDPLMQAAACNDYRAAATIDLEHDRADTGRMIQCPTLIMFGANGAMGRMYDVPATWADRCANITTCPIEGGHFFVDEQPQKVAGELLDFLRNV